MLNIFIRALENLQLLGMQDIVSTPNNSFILPRVRQLSQVLAACQQLYTSTLSSTRGPYIRRRWLQRSPMPLNVSCQAPVLFRALPASYVLLSISRAFCLSLSPRRNGRRLYGCGSDYQSGGRKAGRRRRRGAYRRSG